MAEQDVFIAEKDVFMAAKNVSSVMVSQSHSQSDSRDGHGSKRGRGQRPQCTYCHRLGHIRD